MRMRSHKRASEVFTATGASNGNLQSLDDLTLCSLHIHIKERQNGFHFLNFVIKLTEFEI